MLPAALRRSIAGRWNTMARCVDAACSRPPQVTRPRVGGISPTISRSSVVLPAPFGPISTVGDPATSTSEMPSRMVTPPAEKLTFPSPVGRSMTGARMVSRAPQAPGSGVDHDDDGDQHEAEPDGERQIAFRGLECDRGRHGAGEAVDVAAHDEHRADLRRRAAKAGEQRGD